MTHVEVFLLSATAVVLAFQAFVAVLFVGALRRLRPMEERVAQFSDALGLLTEAAESGFRATAGAIERVAQGQPGRRSGVSPIARVLAAAERGGTVQEVAAAEGLSEAEVSLSLSLAERGLAAEHAPRKSRSAKRPARKAARRKTTSPRDVPEFATLPPEA